VLRKTPDRDKRIVFTNLCGKFERAYDEAVKYCENLNFAGYSDWRLPRIDELISITDKTKFSPAINSAFKYVRSDFYWSSTKFADGSSRAWFVHFKNDYGDWSGISDRLFARCVRND